MWYDLAYIEKEVYGDIMPCAARISAKIVETSKNPLFGQDLLIYQIRLKMTVRKTVTPETASASIPAPTQPKANAPVPTAMSTFVGMILWVADLIQKKIIIFAGLIILAIAIVLYGRKRRRDRLMSLF